jgi:hypothetical protein
MKRFIATRYDKIALGVVGLMLAMSVGGSRWFRGDSRRIKSIPVAVHLGESDFRPEILSVDAPAKTTWSEPVAQSTGKEWVFEVFTPPVVFYDPKTAVFSVTPPASASESDREFTLELIAVKRELYRVQLCGYMGEPGAYIALFSQPGLPGSLLARENEEVGDLGLVLKHFSIRKMALAPNAGGPAFEVAAVADLLDKRSGSAVVIDSRGPKFADALVAVVSFSDSRGKPVEVREGDLIRDKDGAYRIAHVQSDPAEITVAREGEGQGLPATTKSIRLRDRKTSPSTTLSENKNKVLVRPATGLVENEK